MRSKNSNLSLSERHCLTTQSRAGNEHKEAGNRGLPVLARTRTGKCKRPDNLMKNWSLFSLLVFHSPISLFQPEIHSICFQWVPALVSLSRFWSGVGDPVLRPHMLGSPALGSGTSLSFQLVQIYPRVLFPFFNASVSVLLDSPVCFWSCPLGMSSEDKIKLWVDKT